MYENATLSLTLRINLEKTKVNNNKVTLGNIDPNDVIFT